MRKRGRERETRRMKRDMGIRNNEEERERRTKTRKKIEGRKMMIEDIERGIKRTRRMRKTERGIRE